MGTVLWNPMKVGVSSKRTLGKIKSTGMAIVGAESRLPNYKSRTPEYKLIEHPGEDSILVNRRRFFMVDHWTFPTLLTFVL